MYDIYMQPSSGHHSKRNLNDYLQPTSYQDLTKIQHHIHCEDYEGRLALLNDVSLMIVDGNAASNTQYINTDDIIVKNIKKLKRSGVNQTFFYA